MRVVAILLSLGLMMAVGHAAEPPLPGFDGTRAGRMAPDVPFLDAVGGAHRLSEFRGRRVLVVFWASWCPTCLAELPDLAALQAEAASKGAMVVTISQDAGGAVAAERFLRRRGWIGLPAFADPDRRLGEAFGQAWLPTAVLIDHDGREVVRAVGGMDWRSASVQQRLNR